MKKLALDVICLGSFFVLDLETYTWMCVSMAFMLATVMKFSTQVEEAFRNDSIAFFLPKE